VWLKWREIKSQFLTFQLVLVVVTENYLGIEGLIILASEGLKLLQQTLQSLNENSEKQRRESKQEQ